MKGQVSRRTCLLGMASSIIIPSIAKAQVIIEEEKIELANPKDMEDTILSLDDIKEKFIYSKEINPSSFMQITEKSKLTDKGLPSTRPIWLINSNTGEEITSVFWKDGQYDNQQYSKICYLLRDWRENITMAMDPKLLHMLWAIQFNIQYKKPIYVNSGFRTIKTNTFLRAEGSAINSLHTKSSAADITVKGYNQEDIGKYAQSLGIGGVGFYGNRFTHIDTGKIRTWIG